MIKLSYEELWLLKYAVSFTLQQQQSGRTRKALLDMQTKLVHILVRLAIEREQAIDALEREEVDE